VWRRNLLEQQFEMIRYQKGLDDLSLKIIVFQNGKHIFVDDVVERWSSPEAWAPLRRVEVLFIHSTTETGYYGRFLAPLVTDMPDDSYFILCDDDILWGREYFRNMLRVVNEGSFATRNGRFITAKLEETGGCSEKGWLDNDAWFDDDVVYDFGGHIWTGRLGWLRFIWQHPPPSLLNNEDFWLSAVLKSRLNVATKKPKCPKPANGRGHPDLCACSAKEALDHVDAQVGNSVSDFDIRAEELNNFIRAYDYKLISVTDPDVVKTECEVHHFDPSKSIWIVNDSPFVNCFAWT